MSRRYSAEQWLEWIWQQRTSGMSIAAFCESISVSQNAFYVRRRQLADRLMTEELRQQQKGSQRIRSRASEATGFVSLRVVESAQAPMEVDLPCGATIRVNDREAMRDLISAIFDQGATS